MYITRHKFFLGQRKYQGCLSTITICGKLQLYGLATTKRQTKTPLLIKVLVDGQDVLIAKDKMYRVSSKLYEVCFLSSNHSSIYLYGVRRLSLHTIPFLFKNHKVVQLSKQAKSKTIFRTVSSFDNMLNVVLTQVRLMKTRLCFASLKLHPKGSAKN